MPRLAEKLIEITPGDYSKRVLFGLGVVHFKNDYHGSTGPSQESSDFGDLNDGLFPIEAIYIEYDFPDRKSRAEDILERIRDTLKRRRAGAVICEPIQGDAGIIVPPEGFMKGLRRITEETGTILIFDEVHSGMGRTGRWWSFEHEGIVPDIMVTAKGLSGGYAPISAIIGREDVLNSLNPGQHIFTYSGHPPSAAAVLSVINYIETNSLISNAEEIGNCLIDNLRGIMKDYSDVITDVRGRGLMIGIEINVSFDELAGKIFATRCMEKGVYAGFLGVNADVIRIEPPLTINRQHADFISSVVRDTADEMRNGNIPASTVDNVKKYSIGL